MTEHTIGVDISKSHLDVFDAERREAKRFENSISGFRAFEKWLGKAHIARVVYEPTGPYHRNFEERFCDKLPLVKVNPLQARRFAEACGTRAKTDALDARGLARMGVALELEPDIPVAKAARILKDLQVARAALIKERTRLNNRGYVQTNTVLKRQTKARLALVEKQLSELDREIDALIKADKTSARRREIVQSIPGLGSVASAAILTYLPEIGTLDRRQVGSLAGVVPYNRDSGQWKGKSFISGGRKPLRDALYMPALVAMRYNPDLKTKYEALRAAGKPAKVAIVAIMRKLIETANALVKADRLWVPKSS
ncbi:transposase [uncultured Roseovarius sp.]|uniref:transposase n=1 Tax=uncultured Roseovarius sp. TaxID=293344 RepID=UPI0025D11FA6|nr:transposase [uncultured Roseovarius sp.]